VSDAVTFTVPAFAAVVDEPAVTAPDMSSFVEYLNAPDVESRAGLSVPESVALDVVTEEASASVTTGATAVTVNDLLADADA
jgi:hypothetical protein